MVHGGRNPSSVSTNTDQHVGVPQQVKLAQRAHSMSHKLEVGKGTWVVPRNHKRLRLCRSPVRDK